MYVDWHSTHTVERASLRRPPLEVPMVAIHNDQPSSICVKRTWQLARRFCNKLFANQLMVRWKLYEGQRRLSLSRQAFATEVSLRT